MTDLVMTAEKQPNSKQKIVIYIIFTLVVVAALLAIDYLKVNLSDSKQAKIVKASLNSIAGKLDAAEKLGDKNAALSLLEPITKIINDYNDLPEDSKNRLNKSKLRYCVLAATHLSTGITDVYYKGTWANKNVYHNALNACE